MKKFQMKDCYIQRKIVDNDVLISVGENIVNFSGYIELNGSAAFLCNMLKKSCTIGELEHALEHEFELPHEQVAEDVRDFLNELQEHEMVSVYEE